MTRTAPWLLALLLAGLFLAGLLLTGTGAAAHAATRAHARCCRVPSPLTRPRVVRAPSPRARREGWGEGERAASIHRPATYAAINSRSTNGRMPPCL